MTMTADEAERFAQAGRSAALNDIEYLAQQDEPRAPLVDAAYWRTLELTAAEQLGQAVERMRGDGMPWRLVAVAVGTKVQPAHERFAKRCA